MDSKRILWVLVIGLLLIIGVMVFSGLYMVRESMQRAEQAIRPVSDLTSNVATQVAQVLHPTPTVLPDPVTIIHSVRSMARLETIQYTVEKIITAETGQGSFGFLFGDKLILVAHGIVIAGIDLEKITADDMWLQKGVLYVKLPDAEVFVATLDNSKSYIYNRETGILTHGSVDLETTARRAAEEEIKKAAITDGILAQADTNAKLYLERLFLQLGYPDVIFIDSTPHK
ncbi:MAG: DUF4230 domain-containing protein [Chloroflexi bacterium]|nr:DUF4230 domain-containing protein [Chloroflexota bacterium]